MRVSSDPREGRDLAANDLAVLAIIEDAYRGAVAQTSRDEREDAALEAAMRVGRIREAMRQDEARRLRSAKRERVTYARRGERRRARGRPGRRRTPRTSRAGPDEDGDPEPAGPGDPAGVGTSQPTRSQRLRAGRRNWLAWCGERRAILGGIRATNSRTVVGQVTSLRAESAKQRGTP